MHADENKIDDTETPSLKEHADEAITEDEVGNEDTKKLEEEIKILKEAILREKAENQNLRKRHEKELEENHKYSISTFARDLIEVQENMHRAIDNINQNDIGSNPTFKILFEGIKLTQKSLSDVFDKFGVTRIFPLDEQFDHNFHQAIAQVPNDEKPEGSIIQVIQAGYVLKDRLLRPALVAVAKSAS